MVRICFSRQRSDAIWPRGQLGIPGVATETQGHGGPRSPSRSPVRGERLFIFLLLELQLQKRVPSRLMALLPL